MYPIEIIGMGQGVDDLTQKHLKLINKCDVLVGGKRHLSMFVDQNKEMIKITGHLKPMIDQIKLEAQHKKIVVLASGDPLYHGIGSTLLRYFEKDDINIHTNITSFSAAFAAIKEPWNDAKLISFHGKQHKNFSFSMISKESKVAFLTDLKNNPQFIAKGLIDQGLFNFKFCVLENIGHPEEEIITWCDSLSKVNEKTFSQPNIVILIHQINDRANISHETYLGMNDSLFKHSKGLITKSEIRSISLSKLKLMKKDHLLWDIGSGSGSVGIEASFQIPWGQVIAIEKQSNRISDIIINIKNFNCSNIKVVNATFPEGIEELKTPDRIFIGGGGKELKQIIDLSCERLSPYGIVVINTVLLQNLDIALAVLKKHLFNPEVIQVQVSRSKKMPYGDRFEALNPVWIISGSKPKIR